MDKLTPAQESLIGDDVYHEKKIDTMICGLCRWYDSDMVYCEKHTEWGELCERDSCYDYEECE